MSDKCGRCGISLKDHGYVKGSVDCPGWVADKPAEPSPEVAPTQEEMPQVPNDDIYLRAIFQTRDEAVIKALTFTRWKDGIDVEFLNAAARTIIARMTEPLRAEIARLRTVPAVAPRETQMEPLGNPEQCLRYAESLAAHIAARDYPEVPQFKPLAGDLYGLLMQIDNMVTGMERKASDKARLENGGR